MIDYDSSCVDGFSLNLCSWESQKKKKSILYFQNTYCSIVLKEIHSITPGVLFVPGFLTILYTNLTFSSYETTLQTWSFVFSHIFSQKHSTDFYLA